MKINKKIIKELTDYLNEFNLSEIEYTDKDTKIKVSKFVNSNSTAKSFLKNETEKKAIGSSDNLESTPHEKQITSPIIGTAYHSPEPGAKKFVEVGDKIKKGDTVMIVEAMKTMNHVPCPIDGTIKEICVEDGQPVEFGQTIAILD